MGLSAPHLTPRRPLRGWALLCAQALAMTAAIAQPQPPEELKAQIVFRSLLFVEWPGTSLPQGQALQLCLADEGPLATALEGLAGRRINGHALELRRVRGEQFGGCHVALVGAGFDALRAAVADKPVLLVTEAPAMLNLGAMLSLQIEDGRVVFDIGLESARRAGLEISTKLLRLARYVRKA
jgi:hypothetical protein